jgi:altronate dehydratase
MFKRKFYIALCLYLPFSLTAVTQECLNDSIQTQQKRVEQYTQNSTTIIDTSTNLVWQKCLYGTSGDECENNVPLSVDWQGAFSSMVTVNTSTNETWRVPNIIELASLVEPSCETPAVNDEVFEHFLSRMNDYDEYYLWSSTTDYSNPSRAYVLNLKTGAIVVKSKTNTNGKNYLLLVKSQ